MTDRCRLYSYKTHWRQFLQIQPEHAIYDFLGCLPVPPFPTGQLYKLLWIGHTKTFAHISEGLEIALP